MLSACHGWDAPPFDLLAYHNFERQKNSLVVVFVKTEIRLPSFRIYCQPMLVDTPLTPVEERRILRPVLFQPRFFLWPFVWEYSRRFIFEYVIESDFKSAVAPRRIIRSHYQSSAGRLVTPSRSPLARTAARDNPHSYDVGSG